MSIIKDLTGKVYGHFTVLKMMQEVTNGKTRTFAYCFCDCGKYKKVLAQGLQNGRSKSCGTHRINHIKNNPLYSLFKGIKERCYNKKCKDYRNYGGRGISIYSEWLKDKNTFFIWANENGYRKGLQIDRFPDNNGNYEPNNCRFTTSKLNNRNRRSNNKVNFNGVNKCLSEWAEEYKINKSTLRQRIFIHNWDIEKALTTPPKRFKPVDDIDLTELTNSISEKQSA